MTHELNQQIHAYGTTMLEDQPEITMAELHMLLDQVSPLGDVPLVVRAPADRRVLTMAIAAAVVALLVAVPLIFGQLRTDEAPATTIPADPVTTSTTLATTTSIASTAAGPIYALETDTPDGMWVWTRSEVTPSRNVVALPSGFYFLETPEIVYEDGVPAVVPGSDPRVWLWSSSDGETWTRAELRQFEGSPADLFGSDGDRLTLYSYQSYADQAAGLPRVPPVRYVSDDGVVWDPEPGGNPNQFALPQTASSGLALDAYTFGDPSLAAVGDIEVTVAWIQPQVEGGIGRLLFEALGQEDVGFGQRPPHREGNVATVEYEGLGTAVWAADGGRLSVEVFTIEEPTRAVHSGWVDVPEPWQATDFLPSEENSEFGLSEIGLLAPLTSTDAGASFVPVESPSFAGMGQHMSAPVVVVDGQFLLYAPGVPEKLTTSISDDTDVTELVSVRTVYSSPDGISWTEVGDSQVGTAWGDATIVGGGEREVLVSAAGRELVWSTDGIDWNPASGDYHESTDFWTVMEVAGGYLAEWQWNGATGFVGSTDGMTWYPIHRPERLGDSVEVRGGNGMVMLTKHGFESIDGFWIGRWVADS